MSNEKCKKKSHQLDPGSALWKEAKEREENEEAIAKAAAARAELMGQVQHIVSAKPTIPKKPGPIM